MNVQRKLYCRLLSGNGFFSDIFICFMEIFERFAYETGLGLKTIEDVKKNKDPAYHYRILNV